MNHTIDQDQPRVIVRPNLEAEFYDSTKMVVLAKRVHQSAIAHGARENSVADFFEHVPAFEEAVINEPGLAYTFDTHAQAEGFYAALKSENDFYVQANRMPLVLAEVLPKLTVIIDADMTLNRGGETAALSFDDFTKAAARKSAGKFINTKFPAAFPKILGFNTARDVSEFAQKINQNKDKWSFKPQVAAL